MHHNKQENGHFVSEYKKAKVAKKCWFHHKENDTMNKKWENKNSNDHLYNQEIILKIVDMMENLANHIIQLEN